MFNNLLLRACPLTRDATKAKRSNLLILSFWHCLGLAESPELGRRIERLAQNLPFVIPAKAGIQSSIFPGSQIKSGMTQKQILPEPKASRWERGSVGANSQFLTPNSFKYGQD